MSPDLKPDWLAELKPWSIKKPNISLYKASLCIGTTFLHSNGYIYITVYAMVENDPQWFANGSTRYVYHGNTDLIMTMPLIWI